jgi:phosphoglycerol transferase MdoB-like AlkP superfamily enzyme
MIKDGKSPKPYTFFTNGKEFKILESLKKEEDIEHIGLKADPNILIIIWESLTSKITEQYGDNETVPFLNSLKEESIYFDNFYANGSRSDKGLVSIFSGYYPQAMKSIMKETQKSRNLPSLFEALKKEDYKCSFYYGGDTNFGNMNSYFLESGADEIIDGSYFSSKDKSNKWGAYDHIVLNKLLDDINTENAKFCKALFTITSHEPFEIPTNYKFGNNTEIEKFRSAHHYTDESLRTFFEQAKVQDWWDNTLIIIMADHGHPLPKIEKVNVQSERFKIPMIWTGGALNKKDTVITKISSQLDFSKSLLSQLKMDNKAFTFSNDIFDSNNDGFAQYIYTNGFGVLSPKGHLVFDMDQNKRIVSEGNKLSIDSLEIVGKAITQHAFDDYLKR